MAIGFRGSNTGTSGSSEVTLTIPGVTQVGDVIVLFASTWGSTAPNLPAGWTSVIAQTGTNGSYAVAVRVAYKVAVQGDGGASVTVTGLSSIHNGVVITSFSGVDTASPIVNSNYVVSGSSGSTGTLATTANSRRFVMAAQMNETATPQTISAASGLTLQDAIQGQGSGYFRSATFLRNVQEAAGTLPSYAVTSDQPGTMITSTVALRVYDAPPTISNLNVSIVENNGAFWYAQATWDYVDAEDGTEMYTNEWDYRPHGSTGGWVQDSEGNTVGTAGMSPAANGEFYEFRVRSQDTYGNWSNYLYGTFTADLATRQWVLGSELISATQSGTITGLVPGNYEVKVRTSDDEGFSPWSATDTFTVRPPSNVYVRKNGQAVLGVKYVRKNGQAVQLPPTNYDVP